MDKKFYTPAFVIKMDRVVLVNIQSKYVARDSLYYSLHRERVQSNLEEETTHIVNLGLKAENAQTLRVPQLLPGLQIRFQGLPKSTRLFI